MKMRQPSRISLRFHAPVLSAVLLLLFFPLGFSQTVVKDPDVGLCDVVDGASGPEVPAGGKICWRVVFPDPTGTGPTVGFSDTLSNPCAQFDCSPPPNFPRASCDPFATATCTATTITITNIKMRAGLDCEVYFTTLVDAGCAPGTEIENQATVSYPAGDVLSMPPGGTTPDFTVVTVTGNPGTIYPEKLYTDLNGGSLLPCERVHYAVQVTNTSVLSTLLGYIDPLPSAIGPATITYCFDPVNPNACVYDPGMHRVVVPRYDPPADGVTYTVVEYEADTDCDLVSVAGNLCNQGTFTDESGGTYLTDGDGDISNGAQPTCADPPVCLPQFLDAMKTVTDDDGGDLLSGDSVTVRITFSNTGCMDATGVLVTDDIDENYYTNIDASASGGVYGGGVITWSVGALSTSDPPVTLTFTANIQGNPGDPACNQASITCNEWGACAPPCEVYSDRPCPQIGGGALNNLLKDCCTGFPCDLAGMSWPPPQFQPIQPPPNQTTDAGLTTDLAHPLCFYQVEQPTPGNTVKISKDTGDADTIDIQY